MSQTAKPPKHLILRLLACVGSLVFLVGGVYFLAEAIVGCFAGQKMPTDPHTIRLFAASATILFFLFVGIPLGFFIDSRIHRPKVQAWLRDLVPPVIRDHARKRYGEGFDNVCYNPVTPTYLLLSLEHLCGEYYSKATETTQVILRPIENSLVDDFKPNVDSWAEHIIKTDELRSVLVRMFRNDAWNEIVESMPPLTQLESEGVNLPDFPNLGREIVTDMSYVYRHLEPDDPPSNNDEAKIRIANAAKAMTALCRKVDAFHAQASEFVGLVEKRVREFRGQSHHLGGCKPATNAAS